MAELYINLISGAEKSVRTREFVSSRVIADYNKDDELIGIEILDAKGLTISVHNDLSCKFDFPTKE